MRTRCTIKHERDGTAIMGFNLYEDLAEDRYTLMLELEGFTFDTTVWYGSSGELETRTLLRIPKRWARTMGLIADGEGTESNAASSTILPKLAGRWLGEFVIAGIPARDVLNTY